MRGKTLGYTAGLAWMGLCSLNCVVAWVFFRMWMVDTGEGPVVPLVSLVPPAVLGFASGLLLIEISGKGRGLARTEGPAKRRKEG